MTGKHKAVVNIQQIRPKDKRLTIAHANIIPTNHVGQPCIYIPTVVAWNVFYFLVAVLIVAICYFRCTEHVTIMLPC